MPGLPYSSVMPVPESLDDRIGSSCLDARSATVAGLQQAMASGSLTSAELTAFYLARIERLNPGLHAVITVSAQASAEARASDSGRAGNRVRGPLVDIPVLIKDNIAARGMPATAGTAHCLCEGHLVQPVRRERKRERGQHPRLR